MELEAQADHVTYVYHIGLFDKEGDWSVATIKGKDNSARVEETLRNFHGRLKETLKEFELDLVPASDFDEKPIKLSA